MVSQCMRICPFDYFIFTLQSNLESIPGQKGYLILTSDGAIQQVSVYVGLAPVYCQYNTIYRTYSI